MSAKRVERQAEVVNKWIGSALDKQEGGDHYKCFTIQPVEFITKNNLGFCEGNVIKYVCRHKMKNGLEDLRKAKHYLELLAELVYGEKL